MVGIEEEGQQDGALAMISVSGQLQEGIQAGESKKEIVGDWREVEARFWWSLCKISSQTGETAAENIIRDFVWAFLNLFCLWIITIMNLLAAMLKYFGIYLLNV